MGGKISKVGSLDISVLKYYQISSLLLGAGYCAFFIFFQAYWNLLGPAAFLVFVLISYSMPKSLEKIAAIMLVCASWFAPGWCILVSGGLLSPLIIWLAPPTFMAGILINWRWSLGIGLVSVLSIIVLAFFPEQMAQFNEITDDFVRKLMQILALASAIMFLMFYGFSYGQVTTSAQERIENLAKTLEAKVRDRTQALADSEQRFKDIAGSASDWFWEMDSTLKFTYLSERFVEITGLLPEEILGKTRREMGILPGIDQITWNNFLKSLDDHEPHKNFVHSRSKDGAEIWLSISGDPIFDDDGTFQGYRGSGRDITQQKNAADELHSNEQRLHALFHQSPLGMIVEDYSLVKVRLDRLRKEGVEDIQGYFENHDDEFQDAIRDIRFVDANAVQVKMMGASSYEEYEAFERDYPTEADEHWRRYQLEEFTSLFAGETSFSGEFLDTKTDGSRIFLSMNSNIIDPHTGDWSEVLATAEDITERKRSEALLMEAMKKAESANTAKSEFLATMSHEIRTPMTAVLGFADLLLNENLEEENKTRIFHIKDATRSLLTIINGILDLSKLEAGKMEIEYLNFHLPSLIDEILHIFLEKRTGERSLKVSISAKIDDAVPDGILSDPTRLRQILINLIGNAVKFTKEGDVMLDVSLEEKAGGNKIIFTVTDTGIGMTEETTAKLFTDFTQADASINRQYEGSGLGLSICKRLVELMGGEIGVRSELNSGSSFWFALPFEPATEVVRALSEGKSVNYVTQRELDVLLVEDNLMNQKVITAIMQGHGHRVEIADDGVKAVHCVKTGHHDLILMDIRMPNMNGMDATKIIRQMPANKGTAPIIALTADAMEENIKKYLQAGMDDVVPKPIDQNQLLVAINKVMGEEVSIPVVVDAKPAAPPEKAIEVSREPDPDIEEYLKQMQAIADRHDEDQS